MQDPHLSPQTFSQARHPTKTREINGTETPHTENLVGYLYQWNNGDVQPAWFDGAMADVRYEPFIPAPEQNPVDPKIPRPRQQDLTHLEKA